MGAMALPEETWRSDFTGLGWRKMLGLTLFQRNKGRARAASWSSAQRKNPSSPMSDSSRLVGPDPKLCENVCVSLQAHSLLVLDY